jgi:transposase-like protein
MRRNRLALFKGRHFEGRDDRSVRPLVPPVWTQLPDLEEMMAERRLKVDHVTLSRISRQALR